MEKESDLRKKLLSRYQRDEFLNIPLILNPEKSIPIEQHYVNLALIQEEEQKARDKDSKEKGIEQFGLSSYETLSQPKKPIELKQVFETADRKRILILGRAGIGKSTLCKSIVEQWRKKKLWPQYQWLFYIPLRNLKSNQANLIEVLNEHCFLDEFNDGLEPHEKAALKTLIKEQNSNLLLLLDGYDELSQRDTFKLLTECFQNIIVTSRPQAVESFHNPLQLEILGFTSENIHQYVNVFFKEAKNIQAIHQKLEQQSILKNLMSIPLNAELICSIWEELAEYSIITLTEIYQKLLRLFIQRHLSNRKKESMETLQSTDIESLLEQTFPGLLSKMESLAWTMMQQGQLYIESNEKDLTTFGLLRKSAETRTNMSKTPEYYFVHLTFQEFFAARYFVKQLEKKENASLDYFRLHKFNPRFQIVWWFVAGLVKEKESLASFFQLLMSKPRDLLLIHELPLMIGCLEQSKLPNIPEATSLFQAVKEICLTKNYKIKGRDSYFFTQTHIQRILLLSNHCLRQFLWLDILSKEENIHVFSSACEALNLGIIFTQDELTQTIQFMRKALKNNHSQKIEMLFALKSLYPYAKHLLTLEVIHFFLDVSKEKDGQAQFPAKDALIALVPRLPESLILETAQLLFNALNQESKQLQFIANTALTALLVSSIPETLFLRFTELLLSALKQMNEQVQFSMSAALVALTSRVPTPLIPKFIELLRETLKENNQQVKYAAINGLAALVSYIPESLLLETTQLLFNALNQKNDKQIQLRVNDALKVLTYQAPDSLIPKLIDILLSALKQKAREAQWAASTALVALAGRIPESLIEETTKLLFDALKQKDSEVQSAASAALVALAPSMSESLIAAFLKLLFNLVKQENLSLQCKALHALAALAGHIPELLIEETTGLLFDSLKQENSPAQSAVLQGLKALMPRISGSFILKTTKSLLNDLKEKNQQAQFSIRVTLAVLAPSIPESLLLALMDLLFDTLRKKDNQISYFAFYPLAALNSRIPESFISELTVLLFDALKKKHDQAQYAASNAVAALAARIPESFISELTELLLESLKQENEQVQPAIFNALEALAPRIPRSFSLKIIKFLFEDLNQKNEQVKLAVNPVLTAFVSRIPESLIVETAELFLHSLKQKDKHIQGVTARTMLAALTSRIPNSLMLDMTKCFLKAIIKTNINDDLLSSSISRFFQTMHSNHTEGFHQLLEGEFAYPLWESLLEDNRLLNNHAPIFIQDNQLQWFSSNQREPNTLVLTQTQYQLFYQALQEQLKKINLNTNHLCSFLTLPNTKEYVMESSIQIQKKIIQMEIKILDKTSKTISLVEDKFLQSHLESTFQSFQVKCSKLNRFLALEEHESFRTIKNNLLKELTQQKNKLEQAPFSQDDKTTALGFFKELISILRVCSPPLKLETEEEKKGHLAQEEQLIQTQKTLDTNLDFKKALKAIAQKKWKSSVNLYCMYAWSTETFQSREAWIQKPFLTTLREHLMDAGITAILDIEDNFTGSDLNQFMNHLKDADYVLFIGTESLRAKWYQNDKALTFEQKLLALKQLHDLAEDKISDSKTTLIPYVLTGIRQTAFPDEFQNLTLRDGRKDYLSTLISILTTVYQINKQTIEDLFKGLPLNSAPINVGLPSFSAPALTENPAPSEKKTPQAETYFPLGKIDVSMTFLGQQSTIQNSTITGNSMVGPTINLSYPNPATQN